MARLPDGTATLFGGRPCDKADAGPDCLAGCGGKSSAVLRGRTPAPGLPEAPRAWLPDWLTSREAPMPFAAVPGEQTPNTSEPGRRA